MVTGLDTFLKKDTSPADLSVLAGTSIMVPCVYFWVDAINNIPVEMTACVKTDYGIWGLTFPVPKNKMEAKKDSSKLIEHIREVASVLALHGKKILDSNGELNPRLINDAEAARYKIDPLWSRRVKTVDKLIRVKDITKKRAQELKLI